MFILKCIVIGVIAYIAARAFLELFDEIKKIMDEINNKNLDKF